MVQFNKPYFEQDHLESCKGFATKLGRNANVDRRISCIESQLEFQFEGNIALSFFIESNLFP